MQSTLRDTRCIELTALLTAMSTRREFGAANVHGVAISVTCLTLRMREKKRYMPPPHSKTTQGDLRGLGATAVVP